MKSLYFKIIFAHCGVAISKNEIFIFGGYSQDGEASDISMIIHVGKEDAL